VGRCIGVVSRWLLLVVLVFVGCVGSKCVSWIVSGALTSGPVTCGSLSYCRVVLVVVGCVGYVGGVGCVGCVVCVVGVWL
jgi:hypothetical protein